MSTVTQQCQRIMYSKEELLKIRDVYLLHEDPQRFPIAPSEISLDPAVRLSRRKPRAIKIPNDRSGNIPDGEDLMNVGSGDAATGGVWRRGCHPPDTPNSASYRHNSFCSSGGEDVGGSGSECGGGKAAYVAGGPDWTQGCKGFPSDRGGCATTPVYFASGGRGRGRGRGAGGSGGDYRSSQGYHSSGGNSQQSTPVRGRGGFVRRPYGHQRGGFKPTNGFHHHQQLDRGPHAEDFQPHGDLESGATFPNKHLQGGRAGDVDEDGWTSVGGGGVPRTPGSGDGEFRRRSAGGPHETPSSPLNPTPPSASWETRMKKTVEVQQEPRATWSSHDGGGKREMPSSHPHLPTQVHPAPPHQPTSAAATPSKDVFSFMSNEPTHPLGSSPQSPAAPRVSVWQFRDVEGHVRGPYDDAAMSRWFSAGLCHITTEVKRDCDRTFSAISDYITWMGRFPFVSSHEFPPVLEPRFSKATIAPSTTASPLSQSWTDISPAINPPTVLQQNALTSPSVSSSPQSLQPPIASPQQQATPALADLNQAMLADVLCMHRNAQIVADRCATLGIDQSTLIHRALALAANAAATAHTPVSAITPIDVRQLEEAHFREAAQLAKPTTPQPPLPSEVPPPRMAPPPSSKTEITQQPPPTTSAEANVLSKMQETARVSRNNAPRAEVEALTKKSPEPREQAAVVTKPTGSALEEIDEAAAAVATPSKRKKRNKTKNSAKAEAVVVVSSVTPNVDAPTFTAASLEPVDDWDAVMPTSIGHCALPVTEMKTALSTEPKNSRKKKKPTKADLRQQAWEQEEVRRKAANAERLARQEADELALAAAEREEAEHLLLLKSAEAASGGGAACVRRPVVSAAEARRARDLAMKEAAAKLADLKLPSAARWGTRSAVPNTAGTASMADIFADQMQEEEISRAQGLSGRTTFAEKLASGRRLAPSAPDPHPPACAKAKSSPVQQVSLKTPNKTTSPAVCVAAPAAPSLWDLPSGPSNAQTKKINSKKKKANARNAQLLTGPIISLTPKARTELVKWCESQLAGLPQQNPVHLPTLIALICDMEEHEDVLVCMEASFGKSARVSKFSKTFFEKRSSLMGSVA